jgi:hypothetical protein
VSDQLPDRDDPVEGRSPPEADPEDARVREESDAAAAEAGAIGGRAPAEGDPAERPLREAGQGEAEGFEEAEAALEESATHGERAGIPPEDIPEPEEPVDAEFGEADEVVPPEGRPDEGAG